MAERRSRSARTLTTHQAAEVLGVSLPSVINWANKEMFPVHRTPGGHRRILLADLVDFARARRLPLPRELILPDGELRVLIVDDEEDLAVLVADFLRVKASMAVEVAVDAFEAGWMLARFEPDVVLLDVALPGLDAFSVRQRLRQDPATRHVRVLALTTRLDPRLGEEGFDGMLLTPVKLTTVLESVHQAVGVGPV